MSVVEQLIVNRAWIAVHRIALKCTSDQAMQVEVFGIEHASSVAFGLHIARYELATSKDLCLHLEALRLAWISAHIGLSTGDSQNSKELITTLCALVHSGAT